LRKITLAAGFYRTQTGRSFQSPEKRYDFFHWPARPEIGKLVEVDNAPELMKRMLIFSFLLVVQSLAAAPFEGLSDSIARGDFGNIKALVISRHGEILYEDYFRGARPNDQHQVHSITKSVGSALIGIAHRQGRIRLGQDLGHFFNALYPMSSGSYQDKRSITLEAVLQQRHGIEWDEFSRDYRDSLNPVVAMINAADWYQYVLTRPTDAQTGQKFSYSTGVSTLMSRMIRVSTGMSPMQFATQELFGPLGIPQIHWEGFSERGLGTGLTDWRNPDDDEPLGFMLWLRIHDMVKLGELYLNGGVHNGRRILDSAWINASWTTHSHPGNSEYFAGQEGSGYGYQWWVTRLSDTRQRSWNIYYASGWGRQFILVVPDLGLIVASVSDDYDYDGPGIGAIMNNHVFPEMQPYLDQRFNGAWYDPETEGQGLTLEPGKDGESLSGFWYTYDGSGNQRWFLMQGSVNGSKAEVTIYETAGGVFLRGDAYTIGEWGRGRFNTIDCDHIEFEIESDEVTTVTPLTRLTGACTFTPQ